MNAREYLFPLLFFDGSEMLELLKDADNYDCVLEQLNYEGYISRIWKGYKYKIK